MMVNDSNMTTGKYGQTQLHPEHEAFEHQEKVSRIRILFKGVKGPSKPKSFLEYVGNWLDGQPEEETMKWQISGC